MSTSERANMGKRQKSRKGCAKCKERRIRCDETMPRCQQCTKKGLRCPGYHRPLHWSTSHEIHSTKSGPDNFARLVAAASEAIGERVVQHTHIPISQAAAPINSNIPESWEATNTTGTESVARLQEHQSNEQTPVAERFADFTDGFTTNLAVIATRTLPATFISEDGVEDTRLEEHCPSGQDMLQQYTQHSISQPDLISSSAPGTEASSGKNNPAQFTFTERNTTNNNIQDGPFITTPTALQSFSGDVRKTIRSHGTRMDLPPGDLDPSGSVPLADPLIGAEVPTTLGRQVEMLHLWAEGRAPTSELESGGNHSHRQCPPPSPSPPQTGPARPEDNTASQSQLIFEEHGLNSPWAPKVDLPATATPQLVSCSTGGGPSSPSPGLVSEIKLERIMPEQNHQDSNAINAKLCWEDGCNGRSFGTSFNLQRHRERKHECRYQRRWNRFFVTFTRQNDGKHLKAERSTKCSEILPAVLDNLLRRSSTPIDKQQGQKRRLSEGETILRRSKRTGTTCENRDGADGICDYEDPCKGCSERGLERGYKSVDSQAHFHRIEDGMQGIKEEQTTGRQMEMLPVWADGDGASKSQVGSWGNHSHPQCPPPSPPPPGPRLPENYTQYLADFQEHILPLCPLLTPNELEPNKFRSLLNSAQPAEKAVALLVCAFGEWCQGVLQKEHRSSRSNVHYAEAVSLVEHNNGQSQYYLYAHILIALYRGLSGDVYGSGRAIAEAACIVCRSPLSKTPPRDVTAEENSRRVASWICLGMESDLCSLLPYRRFLTGARVNIPPPVTRIMPFERRTTANFAAFVWLYCELNVGENPAAVTTIQQLGKSLPTKLSVDLDAPASNITTALIQATRWNAVVTSYMPSIYRFFDTNPTLEDLEIAKSGILGLIRSLEVFHHLPSQVPLILPNIVGVTYWQVRNTLLLEKCHSFDRRWSFLHIDTDLEKLLDSTTLFLNALSDGPSGLTVDTAVLTSLRKKVLSCEVSSIDGMAWDVLQVNNEAIAFDVDDEDDAEIEQWEYDTETADTHQQGESMDELRARVRWLEQQLASFRGHSSSLA